MATNFPTGIDDLTNPTATTKENVLSHAGQHANANDAIEALQTKVGIDNSVDTTSIDYKLRHIDYNNITENTPTIPTSHTELTDLDFAGSGHTGFQADLGYTPEDSANKSIDGTFADNSDVKYPSQKAVKTYVDNSVGGGIPESLLDAKGDLVTATADNTAARLAVGSNFYKLKADSSETTGLKWQREEVFNVKDYGALGDDSNDDTAEIQAAIDAAEVNGGGTVFLPVGTYKITAELVHNIADGDGGVRIVGESRKGTIIKAYTNTQTVIKFTNVEGSGIENLTILNGITKTGGYGVHFNGTPTQYSVRNVDIVGMYYGIGGSPAAGLCDNVYIENPVHSGIYLIGNGADATFQNILIKNTTDTGSDVGINILGAVQGAVFKNIDVYQTDTGVSLNTNGEANSLEWIFFENVMADSSRGNGWEIGVGTGEPVRGISLINCWAGANTENGIVISNNAIDVNIVGSRIIYNGQHGIYISGGLNVQVSGCKVLNNSAGSLSAYDGINVAAGVSHFTINSNEIASGISDLPSGTQGYGINIASGASDYYVISNNNLYDNGTGGISDNGSGVNKFLVTATSAELNVLDGITSTTAELNKVDGFTGTYEDLNYAKDLRATGVTDTEFDVLDGITATTTELNLTDGLGDAWTSFTPSWTNVTLGNGTSAGAYKIIGKTVFVRATLQLGSTSSVSGAISFNFPTALATYGQTTVIGAVRMFDADGSTYSALINTAGGMPVLNSAGTYLTTAANSSTVPFTWTDGDQISLQAVYEKD